MSSTLAFGALITGCQSTTAMSQTPAQASNTITTYPITQTALQANNWQLVDARTPEGKKIDALLSNASKPLTLNFNTIEGTNVVNLINTCNYLSAPYSVVNGEVKLGTVMSTMMACPDAEAKFDAAALSSVVGKYTLSQGANDTPILVVINGNQVSHFKAVPKTKVN